MSKYLSKRSKKLLRSEPNSKKILFVAIVLGIIFGLVALLPKNQQQIISERTEEPVQDVQVEPIRTASIQAESEEEVAEEAQIEIAEIIETKPAVQDLMAGIRIAEADNSAYNRQSYYSSWSKVDGKCNIRATLLSETSLVEAIKNTNCTVVYGSWKDPYSGTILTGNPYQGDGTANDMEIDHIIPLHYVNQHGGASWSAEKKHEYGSSVSAMDRGVYIAVSKAENQKKSDKGPSQYYPANSDYRCEYSQKWHDLALYYDISLSAADYQVIENTLIACAK